VSHIIYYAVKVTVVRNVSLRIYGALCGPLEIPGGPPVVQHSKEVTITIGSSAEVAQLSYSPGESRDIIRYQKC